jgi:DNA-binding SARP family transcriptional activator
MSGGERPERLSIRLFGPLTIVDGQRALGARDLGGSRPKQVLEILLAARGHLMPSERLAELLWGAAPPRNPTGSLQTFISVLRQRLVPDRDRGRELIVTEAEAYRCSADLIELDLDRFDTLLEQSAQQPTQQGRRSLAQALALVRGEVLEDEPYAVWAQELRGTYQGRVLGAHLDAATSALAELDYADALAHAEAAARLDDFSERAQRCAMLALYGLGRHHDALATYRAFRARLGDELGLEPTAETRTLESAFLRQLDPRSLMPRPIWPRTEQPARSARLLGRSSELDALDRAARAALDGSFRLIQIEADAGLGKTRLLDEFARSLVGVRLGYASCSELERHLPYVPLAAALRDALGGVDLAGLLLPPLSRILPELAKTTRSRRFTEIDALEALVEVVAEHTPLVLILDDLHWADRETIAALHYLQRRCTGVAAAVVTAARIEPTQDDHPIRRLRPDAVVPLRPLTHTDLQPLGIQGIHEATGGIPQFVAAVGGSPTASTALVETLLARCRAEGASAYRMLVAASVLQQPFDPESLATLLQADAGELAEELERLCTRRLLCVDGFGFRFRYQIAHTALLASLSPARRRVLRARLAHTEAEPLSASPDNVVRPMRG